MQALLTYIEKAASRAVAVIVAAVLACGLVPAQAFARTAAADMGIALEVPASAFVDPDPGAPGGSGVRAVDALVGIRVEVSASALVDPDDPAAEAKAADALMGIRLEVPTQAYVDPDPDDPAADVKATSGLMGIRLQVPTSAFVDPDPDDPDAPDAGVRAAEGMFGIRLEVPSSAFVNPDDGADVRAADALVGIRLQVPTQAYVEDDPSTVATASLMGIRLAVSNTHTVTFDANGLTFDPAGVTGTKAVTVLDGACVIQPDPVTATWENHRVVGWYTDPACADEDRYDFSQPVYSNFTLFAKWEAVPYERQKYQLHMTCDDAELADTDKAAGLDADGVGWDGSATYVGEWEIGKGTELPTAAETTRSGYRLVGWYAGYDEATGAYEGDPIGYISREDDGSAMREFWAEWEKLPPPEGDYCTLTFDSRGGSPVEAQTFGLPDGGMPTWPTPPTRSGFEFTGWYADRASAAAAGDAGRFDFGAPIVTDTTAYAGWKRAGSTPITTWRVTFETDGGTYVPAQSVVDGQRAAEPTAPTKAGWKFVGWFDGPGEDATEFDFAERAITADTTVYARWREPERFAVTFYAAGGEFASLGNGVGGEGGLDLGVYTIEVLEGSRLPADAVPGAEGCPVAAPKWAGWQFAGWYPEARDEAGAGTGQGDYAGGAFDFEGTPVEGPTNVFAKWTLRLDVTVPASVGLAVDAGTGKVTAPAMGEYALKSRTVRPVEVEALALESEQAELEGFFELPEGALPDGAPEADRLAAWRGALASTRLTLLADAPGAAPIGLPLAGDADGSAWRSAYALAEAERAVYRMAAFSYAGTAFDELWQGADPSERLPLELGMSIPTDKLEVRADLDGPKSITHLRVTVSAKE